MYINVRSVHVVEYANIAHCTMHGDTVIKTVLYIDYI